MAVQKEDRTIILQKFIESFSGNKDFIFVSGINPCVIKYKGEMYNVYIKNLTPAQLSNNNPNVWRIQLPKRKIFDDIKNSPNTFLLLGYESDADVYATWNPYWCKQRLNVGESVSLYSRQSWQEEACIEEKFVEGELARNGKVVIFPREFIREYIDKITEFFKEETQYVAIGSSLRKKEITKQKQDSISLFAIFSNPHNLDQFKDYLFYKAGFKKKRTAIYYHRYIRFVFDNDLWQKNKSIFMPIQSVEGYLQAIIKLSEVPAIKKKDESLNGGIRASLKKYYAYIRDYVLENKPIEIEDAQSVDSKTEYSDSPEYPKICSEPAVTDYVIDLPYIEDKDVLKKVKDYMNQDPPQSLLAVTELSNYYGSKYTDKYGLQEWIRFVENTDWNNYESQQYSIVDNAIKEVPKEPPLVNNNREHPMTVVIYSPIIKRLEEITGKKIIQKTKKAYLTEDGEQGFFVSPSKLYESANPNYYWYGYRRSDILDSCIKVSYVWAFKDSSQLVIIPREIMELLKDRMRFSINKETHTISHWHVKISRHSDGSLKLQVHVPIKEELDIDNFVY